MKSELHSLIPETYYVFPKEETQFVAGLTSPEANPKIFLRSYYIERPEEKSVIRQAVLFLVLLHEVFTHKKRIQTSAGAVPIHGTP